MVHTTCAVAECKSSCYTNKEVRFHQFPRSEERCKIWVKACKRPDLADRTCESLKNTYMCSLHFEKLMYGKRFLKKTAVPTLLLPSSDWNVQSEKPEVKLLNDSELDEYSEFEQKQYESRTSSSQIASLDWIVKSEKPDVELLNDSELDESSELAQKQYESRISSSQITPLDWIVKSEKPEVESLNYSELDESSELAQKEYESRISSSQITSMDWIVKSEKPEVEPLNDSELDESSEMAQKEYESRISSSPIASLDRIVKSEKPEVELLNVSELDLSSELAQKQYTSGISSSQIAGDSDNKKYIRINRSTQTETRLTDYIPRKPKIKIRLSKTSNKLKCRKNFENIAKKQFLKDCDKYLSPKLSAIVKAQMCRKYKIGK
ncbi:unnamed protein product [Parnassius mnemosyne]|uniref:THAP-type domain-containing protein n=1 Tax=Parnassius mnemosyne TaxID=213953 RepID=A0AAV1LET4_9NEOP